MHIFVGVLIVAPVLLKTASTLYRFLRYYGRTPAYRRKGPPHPLPRILGPFLIVASLALLGTGVALIFVGEQASRGLVTLHQICFWVWVTLLAVHLVGHLWEAAVISWNEVRTTMTGPAARGRRWRYALIVAALIVGVGSAVLMLPSASSWTSQQNQEHLRPRP
jgi:hypothetical protein